MLLPAMGVAASGMAGDGAGGAPGWEGSPLERIGKDGGALVPHIE